MAVKSYTSLSDWKGTDLHFVDIDIGPRGDLLPGDISIHGDRWNHDRLGFASAPGATLLQPVEAARIELITVNVNPGTPALIPIGRTEGFEAGDRCIIEDDDGSEEIVIADVIENRWLEANVLGGYEKDKKGSVNQIKELIIAFTAGLTTGDFIIIEHKNKNTYVNAEIYDTESSGAPEYMTIKVKKLFSSFRKDDTVNIYNTGTGWMRDSSNPLIELQNEYPWDWAGEGVKSAEFLPDVDIQHDENGKELWRKPGLFISGECERDSSQVGLLLSSEEDDIRNWTQFLGNENSSRSNPVIRQSSNMEYFNYTSTADLQKLWNTEDGSISVLAASQDGSSCMQVDYTGSGEVWGLLPVPINCEARTDEANTFMFKVKGSLLNTQGDICIKLIAADGTTISNNFPNALTHTSFSDLTFSFSPFAGRKFVRSVIVGISLSGTGSGTIYIDRLKPFMPASWDEIVEDPTVIAGENVGTFACYYTARARLRQALTSNAGASGSTNVVVDVTDTSGFDAGDIVVLYDRVNFEIGMVDIVSSATRMIVKHAAYDEDNSAEFEYDYDISRQAMVANNTYRVNKIGGSYVLTSDCSDWERWITDDNSRVILEPGVSTSDWDSLSVSQPSVRKLGSAVYIAYAGSCAGGLPSIGFAKSYDFTTFSKIEGNPYIEPGAGSFDSMGCNHPDLFMKPPYNTVTYSGFDGTKSTIGSAIQVNNIHDSYTRFHVTLLVYPSASMGYPPQDGSVLFDMGNFRIDVDHRNRVNATAIVDGKVTTTDYYEPSDGEFKLGWGSRLVHDRWNLIIAGFDGKNIKCSLVNQAQWHDDINVWLKSPWHLHESATPAGTTCVIERKYNWIDAPETSQECLFYGFGTEEDYSQERHFQYNFITGVSQIYDGATSTDRFYIDLANPTGPWGISNIYSGTSGGDSMGLLLAQGFSKINYPGISSDTWNKTDLCGYFSPTSDPGGIFEHGVAIVKTQGPKKISDNYVKLDPSRISPIQIGSNAEQGDDEQNQIPANSKTWTGGYFGHIDIGLDIPLDKDMRGIYNTLLANNENPPITAKPKWHKFNLVGDGATPAIFTSAAYWELTDYDGTKFPDKAGNNHLYLVGASAETIPDGFLGRTFRLQNQSGEAGDVLFITDDFEKKGCQFSEGSGWDSTDVGSPHIFRARDRYHLLYTGTGKSAYGQYGEVIGDLFEASLITAGVTVNASFYILSGTTVSVYLSWEKKTNWGDPVWQSSSPGLQTINSQFWALPGATTDYHYNVRWKVKLDSSPTLDKSPVIKGFSVEYTGPGQVPSEAFMSAQDSPACSSPVHKVQLVLSESGTNIDITSRVKSISNIVQEIPTKPNRLGNIVTDDVTLKVENTDRYFSELDPGSIFYDRFYLNDEIRIFSGFNLGGTCEYQVTGRFLIDRVEIDSRGEAQIYCRSLLREAIDTIVGLPENNQPNPKVYAGKWKVKDIMWDLLTVHAGISPENIYLEDFDRYLSNITIEEKPVGEVLQKLAQACDGVVYTDNQGDIYFVTWGSLPSGSYEIKPDVNMTGMRFTGQRRDRLVKKAIVKGAPLVQGTCVSSQNTGRDIAIENDYIQQSSWADDIAANIITRYGQAEREIELWSIYLPSVKILDTVHVTETLSGLSCAGYLVNCINRNIMEFKEHYNLTSNLAK